MGLILFNLSVNDLFLFKVLPSLYNFADNNNHYAFAATVSGFIKTLEPESEVVVDWFKKNKIVLNLQPFTKYLRLTLVFM